MGGTNGLGGSADWYCKNGSNAPAPTKYPRIKKLSVDRVNGRDELQEVISLQYLEPGPYYGQYYWWDRWFNESGTQTESPLGDANDPFNIGYNQLFSTFSNPPTYDKLRAVTNTAVELISKNNNQFNLQFYTSSSSVLSAPPSKPQNLKVTASTTNHPELTWEANIEPDKSYYKVYKYVTYEAGWQFLGIATGTYYQDISESYCTPGQQCIGHTVSYRVTCIDTQTKESCPSVPVSTFVQGGPPEKIVVNPPTEILPIEYSLSTNYPNPFNPSTIINYAVKDAGLVSIKVYDILGAEVATIVNETREAGVYEVEFNASTLPSGVYIYTMQVNGFISSKKMLLMK